MDDSSDDGDDDGNDNVEIVTNSGKQVPIPKKITLWLPDFGNSNVL